MLNYHVVLGPVHMIIYGLMAYRYSCSQRHTVNFMIDNLFGLIWFL